jgi:hypothetical protein
VIGLGISLRDIGFKGDSLVLVDAGLSDSRPRFLEGERGWGNGGSLIEASSCRRTLMRNRLGRAEISV